jgi:hypothetical protein
MARGQRSKQARAAGLDGETLADVMRRLYALSHTERHRICRMMTRVNYRAGVGERPRLARRWRRYGAGPRRDDGERNS